MIVRTDAEFERFREMFNKGHISAEIKVLPKEKEPTVCFAMGSMYIIPMEDFADCYPKIKK